MKNFAFIDGQNLHLGVKADNRQIDLYKFRYFLQNNLNVDKAFYYIGFYDPGNKTIYDVIKESGFILIFKKQEKFLISEKKGNIDSDMIFEIMRCLLKKSNDFNKIVIISGDGDFKILVDFLIQENRFEKIIFPNKQRASSMYKKIPNKYKDYLANHKKKIFYSKDLHLQKKSL